MIKLFGSGGPDHPMADAKAAKHNYIRVVDESGEDYLYPASFFKPIELPQPIRRAIRAAI